MASSTDETTVFVDTNLNTHLAFIVSDSVIVSDLKRRIVLEHHQSFPAIGSIKIDCLKVERRGNFYNLADSMRVKGAFPAAEESWFISVDASRLEQNCCVQNVDKHKAGEQLALPWVTNNHSIDQGSPSMPPPIVQFDPKVSNVGQITIFDSCNGFQNYTEKDRPLFNKEITSKKRTCAVQNDSLPEDASGSGPSVKKKRKTQKKEPIVKASENLGNGNTIISSNKLSVNSSVHDQVATVVPSSIVDIGAETLLKNAEPSETVPEVSVVLEKDIQQEVPSEVYQKDKHEELAQKTVAGSEIPSSSMGTSDCEPDTSALSHQKSAKSSTQHKAAEKEVAATSSIKKQHNTNTDATDLSNNSLGSTVKESTGVETDKHDKDKETSLIQEPEAKLPGRKKKVKKPAAKNKNESLVKRADNIVSETCSIVPATTVDEKTDNETNNDKVGLSNAEKNEALERTLTEDVTMLEVETLKPTEVVVEILKPTEVKKPTAADKKDEATSLIQEPEAKLPGKKKKVKKPATKNKDESRAKHADNIVSEISSVVLATTVNEKINDETKNDEVNLSNAEKNEALEKTLTEDVTMLEAETLKSTEVVVELSKPTEVVVETSKPPDVKKPASNKKDKATSLIQEPEVTLPGRKRKVKKPAAKNKDESLVKNADNIVGETSSVALATTVGEKINDETKNEDVSLSNAEKNEALEKTLTGDVTMLEVETLKPTEVVVETQKPSEVVVETSKKDLNDVVGSRKTKKDVGMSATRTDAETATNKEKLLPHLEMKESQDITSINALHVDHGSNDAEISKTEKTKSQVNVEGIDENSEKQNVKIDDKKVNRKKRKTKKSANTGEGSVSAVVTVPPSNDKAKLALLLAATEDVDQMKGENEHVSDEGLAKKLKKAKKSHKSSVTAPEDLPSKHQFTEPVVEPEKRQRNDHQTSKSLTVSEVSKNTDGVSNEVNVSKDGSHEIDFLKSFTPGKDKTQSVKEKKPKKTKEPSLVDSRNAMQSQKIASKDENKIAPTNVVKGSSIPNTDQFKIPKTMSKIDTFRTIKQSHANEAPGRPSAESLRNQKSNKQQPTLSKASVKSVKKSVPVKPATIFGGDSDDSSADDNAAANSDSSTRTPSGRSSSGDSATSIQSRRKGSRADERKNGGKDSMNSQSQSKSISIRDLLRNSSRFKRAQVTASQQARDTESQSIDFVPDSQF